MAKKVIKRNGKTVGFDIEKLYSAAQRAWEEVHPKEPDLPAVVRERIATSEKWFQELDHDPTVEEMQDQVVDTFHRCGFHDAGTAFTRYRERRAIARDNEVDANDLINSYLIRKDDLAVKENANMQFSLQGLNNFISESIIQKRWLSYYSDEVRKAHNTGRIHIHDLGSFGPYCMGWSLHDLLIEGFKGVPEKIQSAPAKHFGVALGQAVNFLYTMQGESAGAQAFSNFNTLLAPFVANDKLTYKQVKQKVQEFVYNMNVATRSGFQSTFSNISMDLDVAKTRFADQFAILGGVPTDKTYKEFQKESELIIDAFLEVYDEGDAAGAMFSFPIPTFNVGKDFPWKSAFGKRLLALTAKYGTPYFANFINTEQTEDTITSMCLHGDTVVGAKIDRKKVKISIRDFCTDPIFAKAEILTPLGYKRVIRRIVTPIKEALVVKFNNEKELIMSPDHPHIIKIKNEYQIKQAKDLKVGDVCSSENHPSGDAHYIKGKHLPKETCDLIAKRKKEWIEKHWDEIPRGETHKQTGTHLNEDQKLNISHKMKGHKVTENCKIKSAERWVGLNNPVAKQEYWDRRKNGGIQISKLEENVVSFLSAQGVDFEYQKVFTDEINEKIYVADFYLPQKNLIVEIESKADEKFYKNTEPSNKSSKEKYQWYLEHNIPFVAFNPERCLSWMGELNSDVAIVAIEHISFNENMYDIEIAQDDETRNTHMFYANGIITHNCCRLRLDHKVIEKVAAGMGGLSAEDYATKHNRGGGFFGAGPLTGSTGVVTINMAAQAVDARTNRPFCDIDGYISHVLKTMDMCTKTLLKKRRVLEEMCDDGLYPYMRFYLRDVKARTGRWFAQHFNTICPNAIHEALIVLGIQGGITSPEGLEAADRILGAMAKKIVELQEKHKTLFNLEQAPAESAGVKMCQKSGIDPLGNGYYTNSSWIPADFACDFEFQLRHQARLNRHYSGGSVVHFYTDVNLTPLADDLSKLIEYAFKETTLPYLTISPVFSTCKKCGYIPGKVDKCPKCGGTEVISYSRIVGYLRALNNFNAGRKKEASKRKYVKMTSEGASK